MGGWLGLAIGNSRLHWAQFEADRVIHTWDTPHGIHDEQPWPQVIASVVPAQTQIWQQLVPTARILQLADIPLGNVYPTLGIDRALALWGAIQRYGAPVLVIDGGTAMTLTAADAEKNLVGGAILPGLRILFQTLNRSTAALPEVLQQQQWPDRWATDTETAMRSGILHTVVAGLWEFIQDWWGSYANSSIVCTGGDGEALQHWLVQRSAQTPTHSSMAAQILWDPQLIFAGMSAVVQPDYPIADRS